MWPGSFVRRLAFADRFRGNVPQVFALSEPSAVNRRARLAGGGKEIRRVIGTAKRNRNSPQAHPCDWLGCRWVGARSRKAGVGPLCARSASELSPLPPLLIFSRHFCDGHVSLSRLKICLLIVEEDVGPQYPKYLRLFHTAQEE